MCKVSQCHRTLLIITVRSDDELRAMINGVSCV